MKRWYKIIVIYVLCLLVTNCFPLETKNAEKAYSYWTGNIPPTNIRLLEGEYYQSPHFSLEYEVFLKLKSDERWFSDFIKEKNLKLDTIHNNWSQFIELPEWFAPENHFFKICKRPI